MSVIWVFRLQTPQVCVHVQCVCVAYITQCLYTHVSSELINGSFQSACRIFHVSRIMSLYGARFHMAVHSLQYTKTLHHMCLQPKR
jgi:hypothetical protein